MKLIVTSLVAIIFVAAGSFGAIMLKSPSEASASTKAAMITPKMKKRTKRKTPKKAMGMTKAKAPAVRLTTSSAASSLCRSCAVVR